MPDSKVSSVPVHCGAGLLAGAQRAAPTTSLHLLLELASSKWSDAPITCTRWRVRRGVQCVEGAGERRRGLLAGRACTPQRVRLRISEDGRTGVWG